MIYSNNLFEMLSGMIGHKNKQKVTAIFQKNSSHVTWVIWIKLLPTLYLMIHSIDFCYMLSSIMRIQYVRKCNI